MIERTEAERLATLEADIPWIKESLARLELGVKEVHQSCESHITRHDGIPRNGNGGISVNIGRKTALALLAAIPLQGGAMIAAIKWLS